MKIGRDGSASMAGRRKIAQTDVLFNRAMSY